jgi:prepilin-type N-terminal cleavage/methylation domain-containing protein
MMPTLRAQMPNNQRTAYRNSVQRTEKEKLSAIRYPLYAEPGFTLTELIIVVVMISLFAMLAQINLFGILTKSTFRAQAQELVSAMQTAAAAAAETGKRYEVIIDLIDQKFTLRQITTPDLTEVLEEEIVTEKYFSNKCRLDYVLFDDLQRTGEVGDDILSLKAAFRAGRSGWQYGGKIVLRDENENPYTIFVNRLNRTVTLKQGDLELPLPKAKDEIPY